MIPIVIVILTIIVICTHRCESPDFYFLFFWSKGNPPISIAYCMLFTFHVIIIIFAITFLILGLL